jgi:hypothetical protein
MAGVAMLAPVSVVQPRIVHAGVASGRNILGTPNAIESPKFLFVSLFQSITDAVIGFGTPVGWWKLTVKTRVYVA